MISTQVNCVINAPIEQVWATIRPFDSLSHWHPYVKHCVVEEGLARSEVGCIRRIDLEGGGVVRETLLGLSDLDHVIVYDIIESSMPVANYVATLSLHRIAEDDTVSAEWMVEFDVTDGPEEAMIATLQDIFNTGLHALNQLVSNHRAAVS